MSRGVVYHSAKPGPLQVRSVRILLGTKWLNGMPLELACLQSCAGICVVKIMPLLALQRASRTNFINDLYRRTTLVLRYDLRIISFAVIHVTIPIMYPDIGRPTANHDKVRQWPRISSHSMRLVQQRSESQRVQHQCSSPCAQKMLCLSGLRAPCVSQLAGMQAFLPLIDPLAWIGPGYTT